MYQLSLFPYAYTGNPAVFVAELLGVFYCVLALALLCDEYFVSSLEAIGNKLHLTPDVAGATFMAIGSSSPELFSSFVACLNPGLLTGIGTIFGSSIFNITLLFSVAIYAAGKGARLDIDFRPLFRDSVCFVISMVFIFFVIVTGDEILWYEALAMLLLYGLYIVLMKFNVRLMAFFRKGAQSRAESVHGITELASGELLDAKQNPLSSRNPAQLSYARNLGMLMALSSITNENLAAAGLSGPYASDPDLPALSPALPESEHELPPITEDEPVVITPPSVDVSQLPDGALGTQRKRVGIERFQRAVRLVIWRQRQAKAFKPPVLPDAPLPKRWLSRIFFIISFPLVLLFRLTVPDCRKEKFKNWFALTFLISITYLALICQFMVSWAIYVGCFLHIPDTVMGLTVLAAGSSIPELFSASAVAKQGLGDMVISNSLGSNVFNNLVGLGLPWFIFSFVRGSVQVDSSGLAVYFGIVIFTLVYVVGLFLVQKFSLSRTTALFLLVYYLFFIVLVVLFSFPSDKPVIDIAKVHFVLPNL